MLYLASGCPDNVAAPPNAWIQHSEDHVIVRCIYTDETWYLTCDGNDWIGTVGNCSGPSDGNVDIILFLNRHSQYMCSRDSNGFGFPNKCACEKLK